MLVRGAKRQERIPSVLMDLYWLPVKARIEFKICLLTYKALKHHVPRYLYDCLRPYELGTVMNVRRLDDQHRLLEPRSSDGLSDRAFASCAPRLYNKLPVNLKDADCETAFKKQLKTHLYMKCYDEDDYTIKDEYKL